MNNFEQIKEIVSIKLLEMNKPTQAKAIKYAVNKNELISYLHGSVMTEKEAQCLYDQCAVTVESGVVK